MLHVPLLEFHITNVCNFNCVGCDRFSNLAFAGQQRWTDYAGIYQQWSQYLDCDRWAVLGGEPMTNPDHLSWLQGIHDLWPRSQGYLVTNAHYLRAQDRALYDIIQASQGRIILQIGLHNWQRRDPVLATVRAWLRGRIDQRRMPENPRDVPGWVTNWRRSYLKIKDPVWPDCDDPADWSMLPQTVRDECQHRHGLDPQSLADQRQGWRLQDQHGVSVEIDHEDYFRDSAVTLLPDGRLALHDNPPAAAFETCVFAQNRCLQMIRGRLYKCAPVALFPDLDQQFDLVINHDQRQLIHQYQPADIHEGPDVLARWLAALDQPIPQCRFCVVGSDAQQIRAQHGSKIFVRKRRPSLPGPDIDQ